MDKKKLTPSPPLPTPKGKTIDTLNTHTGKGQKWNVTGSTQLHPLAGDAWRPLMGGRHWLAVMDCRPLARQAPFTALGTSRIEMWLPTCRKVRSQGLHLTDPSWPFPDVGTECDTLQGRRGSYRDCWVWVFDVKAFILIARYFLLTRRRQRMCKRTSCITQGLVGLGLCSTLLYIFVYN
jgi:hypothetical protein